MKISGRAVVGTLLVLASAPVLFLQARELWLDVAAGRYELVPHRTDQSLRSCGHEISLTDSLGGRQPGGVRDEAIGPVTISVDGRPQTVLSTVNVRQAFTDANRYFGQTLLARFRDARTGENALVVAYVLPAAPGVLSDSRYQAIFVGCNGVVREETFGLRDRDRPLYRARLIMHVTQRAVGYRSAVLAYQPSPFYPWLYPWGTGASGVILLTLAFLQTRAYPEQALG